MDDVITGPVQRLSGPSIFRAARVVEVIDKDARRIKVSFSSEDTLVPRWGCYWDEPWAERLGHNPEEVDLGRANGGAMVVLKDHRWYELDAQVGTVEKVTIEDKKGFAEIRFSKREDVTDLWNDVVDGIVRNISVGYNILERILVKESEGELDEYRITRWEPTEISFVPIPADPNVGVGRSQETPGEQRKFVITTEKRNMPPVDNNPTPAPVVPATPEARAVPTNPAPPAPVAAPDQTARTLAVMDMCQRHGMDTAFTRKAVEDGLTASDCGLRILEAKRAADPTPAGSQTPPALAAPGARTDTPVIDADAIFESRRNACRPNASAR